MGVDDHERDLLKTAQNMIWELAERRAPFLPSART